MSANVGDIWCYLGLDISQYSTSINKAGKEITSFEKMASQVSKNLQSVGRDMTVYLSLPIMAMGTAGVKMFADFNKAATESLAIMGDISNQTRKQMESLAIQLSTESVFSAKQLASAYYFLASAGFSAKDSLSALPVVTQFAQAGVFDLEFATSLLADSVKAMGMATGDAQSAMESMTRAGDVLVKANTIANASVSQFSIALTNKAATSLRLVNKTIEEGVAVLAAYANVGVKGERAGTFLAMSLRDLQRAAIKVPEVFQQFGIQIFDTAGAMRSMADIVSDFERAFDGMSDAGKRAALVEMKMQERSILATLALVGQSDKIREYQKILENAGGTMKDVADKQMKAFSNQMGVVWKQIQQAAIALGERLAPTVLYVSKLVADLTQQFASFSSTTQWLIIGVAGFIAIAGPLVLFLAKIVAMLPLLVGGIQIVIGLVGSGLLVAFAKVLAVLASIPLVAAVFYKLGNVIQQFIFDMVGVERSVWKVDLALQELGKRSVDSKEWKKLTDQIVSTGEKLEIAKNIMYDLIEAGKDYRSHQLEINRLELQQYSERIDRLTKIAKAYRESGDFSMAQRSLNQIEKMREIEKDMSIRLNMRHGILKQILDKERAINFEKERAAKRISIAEELDDIMDSRSTDKYATRLRKIKKDFDEDMDKIKELRATSKTYTGGALRPDAYFDNYVKRLKEATEIEKRLVEERRMAEINAVLATSNELERVRLLKQKAEIMLIARGNEEKERIEKAYNQKLKELEEARLDEIRNLVLAEETIRLKALQKRYEEMNKLAKNDKERQMVQLGFAKERAKVEKSIIQAEANRRQVIGRLTGLEVGTQEGYRELTGNTDEDLKIQNEIAASNRVQERLLQDIRNYGIKIENIKVKTM